VCVCTDSWFCWVAIKQLPKNVKGLVLAELYNAFLNNRDKFEQISDENVRQKIDALLQNPGRVIAPTSKSFSFSNY